MSFVETLWLIASLLAAASLVIVTGLILARAVRERRSPAREHRRRAFERTLLGQGEGEAAPGPVTPWMIRVFADLLERTNDPARRAAILERADALGIPARMRRDLRTRLARYRSAAAAVLAEFPDEETVAALTAALGDRHPDVRLAAALSLARLERAPPAAELLDRLGLGTREPSGLVIALFDDIARAHPGQIVKLVELPGVPANVRAAAIDAMSASRDRRFVDLLSRLARDAAADAPELPRYLEELGELGDPAAGPTVRRWLDGPDPTARAAAAQAAGLLRLKDAGPRLAELLGDGDWWVRFRASEALLELGEDGTKLLALAAAQGRQAARETAAIALAERGLAP